MKIRICGGILRVSITYPKAALLDKWEARYITSQAAVMIVT